MKRKNSTAKKIKSCIATSPLLKFMQHKRRKTKTNVSVKRPKRNSIFLETDQTLQMPTFKKPKCDKIVSQNSKSAENVYIVQMPSKYKSYDNIPSLGFLCDSEKDDADKFTSLKCLMSAGVEINPYTIDICEENSSPRENNNVANHNDQEQKSTLNTERRIANKSDEVKRKCFITVSTLDKTISTASVYELNYSKYLVILKPDHLFYFIGIIELEVIQGSVEFLGCCFHERKKKIVLFSPLGYSHIYIKAKANGSDFEHNCNVKTEDLLLFGLSESVCRDVLRESEQCSVFILTRKNDHVSSSVWPNFFETHLPFSIFPQSDTIGSDQENRSCQLMESKIGCILDASIKEQGKEFVELPEWTEVVRGITFQDYPKVILCGGKSVGKSTFLRYLSNKLLKKLNKVLVLDFDPGQCEFTIGGCISATLVEEPLLGPNFSHLKQPLRSIFIGEVDVTKCPEAYIEGCKYLINFAEKEYGSIPWLVNTMGFSKGFGVTLTCGIIQNVGPTNVIQIQSKNKQFNFPSLLEPGFVYNQNISSFNSAENDRDYNLHILQSAPEYQPSTSQKIRGISPLEARNLVILSYLSNMLDSVTTTLSQVTPYMINMEHIDMRTTNKGNLSKDQIAAALNGNLVALCHQTKDDAFPNCQGFGIVRGIDKQAGVLYLITPADNLTLRKINCLIKGNVNLPESLYYNPGHHIKGHVPYMAHTSGGSTALFAKRDYRILPATSRESTKRQSR